MYQSLYLSSPTCLISSRFSSSVCPIQNSPEGMHTMSRGTPLPSDSLRCLGWGDGDGGLKSGGIGGGEEGNGGERVRAPDVVSRDETGTTGGDRPKEESRDDGGGEGITGSVATLGDDGVIGGATAMPLIWI